MSARRLALPELYAPSVYWEQRAQRFAARGDGLAAVCSYGLPDFHNRTIHLCQHLALRNWLRLAPGVRVLDVGCGVGRWTLRLAAQGAAVTGVDLSPTMLREAGRRAAAAGVGARCQFVCKDIAELRLGDTFDFILGVTVLQHILDATLLRRAIRRLVEHLAPSGRLVLLEAAPVRPAQRCDTPVFTARRRDDYLALFAAEGLRLRALAGVDPAPFRAWLVPHLAQLPHALAIAALATATALSAPFDLLLGRLSVERSWHAVFVLEHAGGDDHA